MLPFSDEELLKPVLLTINQVRPMLLNDGGDIKVIEIKNGCVFVQFQGACQGCHSKHITLKNGIQSALQRDIHPDIEVKEII